MTATANPEAAPADAGAPAQQPKGDILKDNPEFWAWVGLGLPGLMAVACLAGLAWIGQYRWLLIAIGLAAGLGLALGRLGWRFGPTRWLQKQANALAWTPYAKWIGVVPAALAIAVIVLLWTNFFFGPEADGKGLAPIQLAQTDADKAVLAALRQTPPVTLQLPDPLDGLEEYERATGYDQAFGGGVYSQNGKTRSGRELYNQAIACLQQAANGNEKCKAAELFKEARESFEVFAKRRPDASFSDYASARGFVDKASYGQALAQMCWAAEGRGQAADCSSDWKAALDTLQAIKNADEKTNKANALTWGLFKAPPEFAEKWQQAAQAEPEPEPQSWAAVFAALRGDRPKDWIGIIPDPKDGSQVACSASNSATTPAGRMAGALCSIRLAVGQSPPKWEAATTAIGALPESQGGVAYRADIKAEINKKLEAQLSAEPKLDVRKALQEFMAASPDLIGKSASIGVGVDLWGNWFWLAMLAFLATIAGWWLAARHRALHQAMRNRIGTFHHDDRQKEMEKARAAAAPHAAPAGNAAPPPPGQQAPAADDAAPPPPAPAEGEQN